MDSSVVSEVAKAKSKTKPAAKKPSATASGEPIVEAPGENQFLIDSTTPISAIVDADQSGKNLVFSILDFPELSSGHLAQLSPQAQMAYQMDMRNAQRTSRRMADGSDPFESRVKVLAKRDPLHRKDETMRVGQAKSLPKGKKHMNVSPEEVEELERVGYQKAKPDEVDIVGAREKGGAVALLNKSGSVDNVTMLVDEKDYEQHRKVERETAEARVEANVEQTKENMRQYMPKVHIYDKNDLRRK